MCEHLGSSCLGTIVCKVCLPLKAMRSRVQARTLVELMVEKAVMSCRPDLVSLGMYLRLSVNISKPG